MKKSVILAALGLATAASSYGQGLVYFTSYSSNDATGTSTRQYGGTTSVPADFTAQLYYAFGTVLDPVNNSDPASISSAPTGLTSLGLVGITFNQPYQGNNFFNVASAVQIPGYVSGPITFEVVASGQIGGVDYSGRSGSFTMASINTVAGAALGTPTPSLGDGGGAGAFPNFYVATAVPEPTTLALAGLGGLASLVMLRRKQA